MTTLEPKLTTPLSQLILIKPDRNGPIPCEIVSNIGQTLVQKINICQKQKHDNRVMYLSKLEKNPEKIIFIIFHMLKH